VANDDLAAFLKARLDEDEVAAKLVRQPYRLYVDDQGRISEPKRVEDLYGECDGEYEQWGDGEDRMPNHIATWSLIYDPARVLREVEAKRRILDEHAIVNRQIGWLEDGEEDSAEIPVCRSCVPKHSWYGRRADVPDGPCATARLLALPYADVDGYREEWRP
jgi:hypothetical protein